MSRTKLCVWIGVYAGIVPGLATGQSTARVSVTTGGVEGNLESYDASISADGRFVAFRSRASNLVAGDTNACLDVFVRDRLNGLTERVSVDSSGIQGNGDSSGPSISADGRYVAFRSESANLVPGDTNGWSDIFVRDRLLGLTDRASVASGGAQGNWGCGNPSISSDGRFVAFLSGSSNLVSGDTNGTWDVFLRDLQSGTTERVSVDSVGGQANGPSDVPSISADGRFVAFESHASNLVAGDTNGFTDIFLRDRQLGTTQRVSVSTGGAEGDSDSTGSAISADGRYVGFHSTATGLVASDTNACMDVFVRDCLSLTTERVSVNASGAEGDSHSYDPALSADGRFVAFDSNASNLIAGDVNGFYDVFVRDRQNGTTQRVSIESSGVEANGYSFSPSVSGDGRLIAFESWAWNLVAGDTNLAYDVFVHDRGLPVTYLCDPAVSGVIACPCSNPPTGSDRGCDSREATGGASITASGGSTLAAPTLVFTTAGENATVGSVLIQGTAVNATGLSFGHGVRCAAGSVKRLYVKVAVSGSITAPALPTDADIPTRSAALGDTILAGQQRWYQVYYRDTTLLLPGCAVPSNQFNVTNAAEVTWLP